MGFVATNIVAAYSFLYGIEIPRKWELSIIALTIYAVHLAISGSVLYGSLKIGGGGFDFVSGFSRAIFTVFVRDLIALPLLVLMVGFPLFGMIVSLIAWLGLIKFVFQLSWARALLVFIITLILPFVILLLILIPVAMALLGLA